MATQLTGTGVALVTPFANDGSIDFEGFRNLIEHVISNKADYLVPLGTTGETATLSKEEKKKVFDFVLEVNDKRLPLVAGIGGNNTTEIVNYLKEFSFEGYGAILSVSPYYNKPSQEGIFQHYKQLAEFSSLPIILYNVPSRTGSNMLAETTLRLAELPNIIGIKEASGDFEQFSTIIEHMPADFHFISGDDGVALPMIALGGHGLISVIGNAFPKETAEMVRHCLKGDFESARPLHYKLMHLIPALFEESNPTGVKETLKQLGICGNHVRLPLVSASERLSEKIKGIIPSDKLRLK